MSHCCARCLLYYSDAAAYAASVLVIVLFCFVFKGEGGNHPDRLSHIPLCLMVVLEPNLGGCYIVQFLAAYAELVLVFVFFPRGGRKTYTQTA